MFAVGDKVVHPNYGPGVIVAIERRQVLQEEKRYYVINMLTGGGTLRTPVRQADNVGLRLAVSGSSIQQILESLSAVPCVLPGDFRERQAVIQERLKEGDVFAAADVLRDLAWHDKVHGLTKRDAQLKQRAEDLLAAELALVRGIEVKAALEEVQRTVADAVRAHAQAGGKQV